MCARARSIHVPRPVRRRDGAATRRARARRRVWRARAMGRCGVDRDASYVFVLYVFGWYESRATMGGRMNSRLDGLWPRSPPARTRIGEALPKVAPVPVTPRRTAARYSARA